MDISVSYIKLSRYKNAKKNSWLFSFYKFKFIKGISIRIFGVELFIKESNSLAKILAKLHGVKIDSNI